jgi:hypothetical protein
MPRRRESVCVAASRWDRQVGHANQPCQPRAPDGVVPCIPESGEIEHAYIRVLAFRPGMFARSHTHTHTHRSPTRKGYGRMHARTHAGYDVAPLASVVAGLVPYHASHLGVRSMTLFFLARIMSRIRKNTMALHLRYN